MQDLWPYLFSAGYLTMAAAVTVHAVLHKRNVQAVIAWVGLAWMAPVIGPVAYVCLGINRIQRKGVSLNLTSAWKHERNLELNKSELARSRELLDEHPGLLGLSNLGGSLTSHPLLPGNRIEILINGEDAYPRMLEAIRNAKKTVALLSYIFDSDEIGGEFFEALREAHERGVEVRVLIDAVGGRYSKVSMVKRLEAAGVPAAAFLETNRAAFLRYANLRNHRKILVVDGVLGFTGGTNIRDGHIVSRDPTFPVRCTHFQIEGPVIADLMEAFATDWAFTTGESIAGEDWFPAIDRKGPVGARGIPDGPDEDLDKMLNIIIGGLGMARKRVDIVTPYFLPDAIISSALEIAAMRGVEVNIVIPRKNNVRLVDWALPPHCIPLLEKGCRIFLSPEPFDHSKLMIVDGIWSLVGSTNWDARSLRLNFEYNLECYDDQLAEALTGIAEEKRKASTPLTLEDIQGRTLLIKIRDGLARLLSPYL